MNPENYGFRQYDRGAFEQMCKEQGLYKDGKEEEFSVSQASVGDGSYGFKCTSTEVVNSVLDDIGRWVVDNEQGLQSLEIVFFGD